jgi:hypothetical protein
MDQTLRNGTERSLIRRDLGYVAPNQGGFEGAPEERSAEIAHHDTL